MNNASTKRRNAIIAGVAGAALLVGGSTYALWSATGTVDGGTITAGNLDIAPSTASFWDVSADRSDSISPITVATGINLDLDPAGEAVAGHAITTIGTWRIVPEDTVAAVFPFTLTLEGDNLVAGLSIDATKLLGADTASTLLDNATVQYATYDAEGKQVFYGNITKSTSLNVGYFQAPETGQAAGSPENDLKIPYVDAQGTSTTGNVYVVIYVTFNDVDDQTDVTSKLDLSAGITATLQQVRCTEGQTAGGNFTCN